MVYSYYSNRREHMKSVICQECKVQVSRRKSYAIGHKGDGFIQGKTKANTPKGITTTGPCPRICKDRKACKSTQEKKAE